MNTRTLILTTICFTLCIASFNQNSFAQSASSGFLQQHVSIDIQGAPSLQIIQELQQQCHINLILDDTPFPTRLDFKFDGSMEQALNKFSSLCDCSWKVNRDNCILMAKRFADINDTPQLNLPELSHLADSFVSILHLQPTETKPGAMSTWYRLVVQAAKTFTPEQWAVLKTGKNVSLSSLTSFQRNLLMKSAYYSTFGDSLGLWDLFDRWLKVLPGSILETKVWVTPDKNGVNPAVNSPRYYTYLLAREADGNWLSRDLDENQPPGIDVPLKPVSTSLSLIIHQRKNIYSFYSKEARMDLGKKVELESGNMPLNEIALELLHQTGLNVIPEPYLRKHATVMEVRGLTAFAVLNSLCELNDWDWEENTAHQIVIQHHHPKLPREVRTIGRLIQSSIPIEMRHFMHIHYAGSDMNKTIYSIDPGVMHRVNIMTQRLALIRNRSRSCILKIKTPQQLSMNPVTYNKMTPAQKHDLFLLLLTSALLDTNSDLFIGDTPPYVYDTVHTIIYMAGNNTLMYGLPFLNSHARGFMGCYGVAPIHE